MSIFRAAGGAGCHGAGTARLQERENTATLKDMKKIAIVGNPNVGKSVIFNSLTGAYVNVSNYPGTTVEVSRGKGRFGDAGYEVIDTPGMYSLLPITEEERVAREFIMEEKPDIVLHVVDAKNPGRMLPLTLQLIEAGLPVILDINIIDEAERVGLEIDTRRLEEELTIPVVATSGISGKGMDELKRRISEYKAGKAISIAYNETIEKCIKEIEDQLKGEYIFSRRAIGLLLLQEDPEILEIVEERERTIERIKEIISKIKSVHANPLHFSITMRRQAVAGEMLKHILKSRRPDRVSFQEKLNRMMINPVTGIPILLVAVYFGLYQFVGVFGAGTLVDFLEEVLFGEYINPFFIWVFESIIPWPVIQDLFVGEYGILTLGLRYAVAIILPIVGTFFISFSILEDTGYFPRLAMLVDRLFKKIGLNGRAIIPMVLGFGCDTMATMVTRTLETKRERVLATLLLALAIPCSAQLGVILAILSAKPLALLLWAAVVTLVFLLTGFLAARLMPGERPDFYMELPPLRLPKLTNVLAKTVSRMQWYLMEVIPLFLLASVLIWAGRLIGLFQLVIRGMEPLVKIIGLPEDTALVFLFGFFRRDYGAAGLYDLQQEGLLSGNQLVIAAVTLTLFVPCIAQFSMMLKERGLKTTLGIILFIFPFAFLTGFLLNILFSFLGVQL